MAPRQAVAEECDCGAGMPRAVCTPATLRMTTEGVERANAVQRAVDGAGAMALWKAVTAAP
jgi:hypothetical protein